MEQITVLFPFFQAKIREQFYVPTENLSTQTRISLDSFVKANEMPDPSDTTNMRYIQTNDGRIHMVDAEIMEVNLKKKSKQISSHHT